MRERGKVKRIVVGVTGASGAVYAQRLIECLCEGGIDVRLVVSPNGQRLLGEELDISEVSLGALFEGESTGFTRYAYDDVGADIASGSFTTDGMIICPCSSNTLASIASGLADNLLHRAAAVTLKERRRLVVVPREMPLSRIDLENAIRLTEAGGVVCPASPGFYMKPRKIADLVDFVVGRVLDLVGVCHSLDTRWSDRLDAGCRPQEDAGDQ